MTFSHLDDATVMDVSRTLIELGLTTDSDVQALTAGISPPFVGTALGGGTPNARVLTLVNKLNATRVLSSGEVPLTKFLNNAILLTAGRTEEVVFRTALERMSADGQRAAVDAPGAPPPPAAQDVDSLPAAEGQLEIAIGEDDTLEVAFLHRGTVASRSVAKLLVHRHFQGQPSFLAGNEPDIGLGTGWLLAPRLAITNFHVVNARLPIEPPASQEDFDLQGRNIEVQFDFLDAKSTVLSTHSTQCVASDPTLDYALLRLPDDAPDRPALHLRSHPITRTKDKELRERVNVLQHPNGEPMRLGFRNNFVVSGSDERLSYLTDTAGGSSGSPICDDLWFVAALHRGFATIPGEPVMVWGRPIHQENYGTPINQILAHLATNHADLHAEVVAGQAALVD